MTSKNCIPTRDREFCQSVAQAVFSNPFDRERGELYQRIIGRRGRFSPDGMVEGVNEAVSDRIQRWEEKGKANLRAYVEEDRAIMRMVLLFECYHRFYRQLDRLIQDQIKAGDESCEVDFAKSALSLLLTRGFNAEEARRFFAIFYQIRRAHHFIAHGLAGSSPCMRELRRHLWNNVFTYDIRWYDQCLWNRMEDFSTLLLGETGTGKGMAAAAIGRSGFIPFDERKGRFAESFTRAFVSMNLSQFQEALIESELFGHRKGAFTGAIDAHQGVLSRCSSHGAVFLDEIGDVSVPIQIKLLQVLQERTFRPVGSHEKLRFRGRVIAATNKPVDRLRKEGLFRDDFFYRLCSDSITVPPLRQRLREDPKELDQLLAHLIMRMTGDPSNELASIVQEVIDTQLGKTYPWPGNVRELEQAVRQILLTRNYEGSQNQESPDLKARLISGIENGSLDADAVLAGYSSLLYQRLGSYEAVARQTNLDRRTVKKYILQEANQNSN